MIPKVFYMFCKGDSMKKAFPILLTLALFFGACAQNKFPAKDVTVIIPNAPGGGTDRSVRGLLDIAKKYTGAKFIVENRPGAATAIGTAAIANAKPDGYTIGAATVELAMLPHINQMPVDHTAFKPLVFTIGEPGVITVKSDDARFKTAQEFIAYAKANPKKIKIGTTGVNSIWYVAAVQLQKALGIEFTIVPYEKGSADAVAALVGGHVDCTSVGPATVKSQVDAKILSMLAIITPERSPLFPELPTIAEVVPGVKPFAIRAWAAIVIPAKVPQDVYEYWKDVFTKAAKDPDFEKYLRDQSLIMPIGMDDAAKVIAEDSAIYKEILQSLQAK